MSGQRARVARLEAASRAQLEAVNGARVRRALAQVARPALEDLHAAMQARTVGGLPAVPPDAAGDRLAALTWAHRLAGLSKGEPWPAPPPGAGALLAQEDRRHPSPLWAVFAALAQAWVLPGEGEG